MNHKIAQEIVRTLRVGGIPGDCQETLSRIRPGQWMSTLSWLRRSGLALYWWSRIKSGQLESEVPENIRARLDADMQENRARLSAMTEEFQSLVKLIEEAEIPYAVLKGFSLIPEYCPDVVLRNQYDFDFLVDAGSIPQIDEVFRRAGFIPKPRRPGMDTIEYFHALRRPVVPDNLDKVFSPGLHRTVEIHTNLWEANVEKIHFNSPVDCLNRAAIRTWNEIAFPSLAPEEVLVLQALHIFQHILNNKCRLSHLFELAWFLNRSDGSDVIWPAFEALAQTDNRLREVCGIVFSLAAEVFGALVPREAQAFTVDRLTRASSFWVRRYGIDSALSNFSGSKSSLYLHGLFVDAANDWRELRRRRLFPFRIPAMVAKAPGRNVGAQVTALSAQMAHVAQRSWYHGMSAVKYLWGLPEWRRYSKPAAGVMVSRGGRRVALAPGSPSSD